MNWRDLALQMLLLWWRITKPTVIGVRGIITDEQGRVLLVRHNYGKRSWIFPGGGLKGGEAADVALIREMSEETGLEVEIVRLVGVYLSYLAYKRDHVFVFECRQIRRCVAAGRRRDCRGELVSTGGAARTARTRHAHHLDGLAPKRRDRVRALGSVKKIRPL